MEIKTTLRNLDPYQQKLDKAENDAKIKRDKSAGRANGSGQEDRVSLSPEAKLRTEAYRTAQNTDEIRTDKVEEIKARIANGTYEINTRKIAENLIRDDLDLLF